MKQITLRIPLRTLAELEREAADAGRTRSKHIREVLESRRDMPADARDPERVRELEAEIAELEQAIEACRNQNKVLTDAYQLNAETQELVKARKAKADASLVERARWWVFGRE